MKAAPAERARRRREVEPPCGQRGGHGDETDVGQASRERGCAECGRRDEQGLRAGERPASVGAPAAHERGEHRCDRDPAGADRGELTQVPDAPEHDARQGDRDEQEERGAVQASPQREHEAETGDEHGRAARRKAEQQGVRRVVGALRAGRIDDERPGDERHDQRRDRRPRRARHHVRAPQGIAARDRGQQDEAHGQPGGGVIDPERPPVERIGGVHGEERKRERGGEEQRAAVGNALGRTSPPGAPREERGRRRADERGDHVAPAVGERGQRSAGREGSRGRGGGDGAEPQLGIGRRNGGSEGAGLHGGLLDPRVAHPASPTTATPAAELQTFVKPCGAMVGVARQSAEARGGRWARLASRRQVQYVSRARLTGCGPRAARQELPPSRRGETLRFSASTRRSRKCARGTYGRSSRVR